MPGPIDICVTGDVHGHMQLALVMAARWQMQLDIRFDAVLLCGDIGAFRDPSALDRATRRHAETNPCELEMLNQWMAPPPCPRLGRIFEPLHAGGLGLQCPVIMTHGNHEDFAHLAELAGEEVPQVPISVPDLPTIDAGGWISYLPSGWRTTSPAGVAIGAIGGIQPGQRPKAGYPPLAYITDDAVVHLVDGPPVDVLITHQGPNATQGSQRGSDLLDLVLERGVARTWCHGHSVADDRILDVGRTRLIPLNGVPFTTAGPDRGAPGKDAWCWLRFEVDEISVVRERPMFWRELDQRRWQRLPDGQLVAPHLAGA